MLVLQLSPCGPRTVTQGAPFCRKKHIFKIWGLELTLYEGSDVVPHPAVQHIYIYIHTYIHHGDSCLGPCLREDWNSILGNCKCGFRGEGRFHNSWQAAAPGDASAISVEDCSATARKRPLEFPEKHSLWTRQSVVEQPTHTEEFDMSLANPYCVAICKCLFRLLLLCRRLAEIYLCSRCHCSFAIVMSCCWCLSYSPCLLGSLLS